MYKGTIDAFVGVWQEPMPKPSVLYTITRRVSFETWAEQGLEKDEQKMKNPAANKMGDVNFLFMKGVWIRSDLSFAGKLIVLTIFILRVNNSLTEW